MRWIVHIGAPKTGSTAIQRFLFDNRSALGSQGIDYPDVSLRGYGHHDLAFLLNGGYPDWATPQARYSLADLGAHLRAYVVTGRAETVVLSSENFYLYPRPAELLRLIASTGCGSVDQITIVCYVRRQDEAHISWYNQTVKAQGNAASFETTVRLRRDLWDYAARLEPWRVVFGTPSILIRDYTPFSVKPADVRVDFARVVGIAGETLDFPPARDNERINRDIVDFQRVLNRLPMSIVRKRRYHKRLIELTTATSQLGVFDDSPFLTLSERAALVESYAHSNSRVATTFLGQENLFEPVSSSERSELRPPRRGLTARKIALILKGLLDGSGDR